MAGFRSIVSSVVERAHLGFFQAVEALNRREGRGRMFFESSEFPWVAALEADWESIRKELDSVLTRVDRIPNFQEIDPVEVGITNDDRWKVFVFHAYGRPYEPNCVRCPNTAKLLSNIPQMTTAMFSVLRGPKNIPPHRGPFNGVLRYHLALKVPGDPSRSSIRVGTERRSWSEGKSLIFDDTFEHEVTNENEGDRVVLFVDFVRPTSRPLALFNRLMVRLVAQSDGIREAIDRLGRWEDAVAAPGSKP